MALTDQQVAQRVEQIIGAIRNPPRKGPEGKLLDARFGTSRPVPADTYFVTERVIKSGSAAGGDTLVVFTVKLNFIVKDIQEAVAPETEADITPEVVAERLQVVDPTERIYERGVDEGLLPVVGE